MAHVHAQVYFFSFNDLHTLPGNVMRWPRTMWFVNSGSFLKRGSGYAAAKGYPPTVMGCPVIEMSGTEHKVVVTMGRRCDGNSGDNVMVDIKLIQGDCLEKMKDIPDGSIDAIITDPPWHDCL